ncbi:MAG: nicotinate-nicotinamide nucleotide adenylyltransferase [Myxococcaceae bacterium]|nr:nicotinate-nicotinamide nucleotide adenylyltransferase [Myxococcaceae bacterium]MCA3012659.1 nicotinate-nicotinamide nucleotide adenylyltransferase [Myxococcaceae bacterium]
MAATFVRATRAVDEVWLVPAFDHPFGKALTPFDDRVALCERLGQDCGPWFKVSRAEAEVGKEGRTIELLEYLLPQHPDTRFHFVIGSDILADLPKWKAWDRIEALVEVVVLHRAGFPSPRAFGPPIVEVSSTAVRAALNAGLRPDGLVPRQVLDLIESRQLTFGHP